MRPFFAIVLGIGALGLLCLTPGAGDGCPPPVGGGYYAPANVYYSPGPAVYYPPPGSATIYYYPAPGYAPGTPAPGYTPYKPPTVSPTQPGTTVNIGVHDNYFQPNSVTV